MVPLGPFSPEAPIGPSRPSGPGLPGSANGLNYYIFHLFFIYKQNEDFNRMMLLRSYVYIRDSANNAPNFSVNYLH